MSGMSHSDLGFSVWVRYSDLGFSVCVRYECSDWVYYQAKQAPKPTTPSFNACFMCI